MCGIVGILGKGPVATDLVDALKRLEYRGYDSAGIATLEDSHLERRRSQLTARLASSRKGPAGRTIDRYTRSLLEHRATSTQHDLEWIDELIAQERSEQLDRPEGATA